MTVFHTTKTNKLFDKGERNYSLLPLQYSSLSHNFPLLVQRNDYHRARFS